MESAISPDTVHHDRLEIWSGGQTGVDRAALDVAIQLGIPYAGWLPRGRMAEDGPLSARYAGMRETGSPRPDVRTRRNVLDTDATLVIAFGPVTGGTALAVETAARHGRRVEIADLNGAALDDAARRVREWLASLGRPLRLNVAGPRESTTPGAYRRAHEFLLAVLREEARG